MFPVNGQSSSHGHPHQNQQLSPLAMNDVNLDHLDNSDNSDEESSEDSKEHSILNFLK